MTSVPPIVLAISGHDPSGGAGIQADIEAIAGNGCHCGSVITTITEQDTRNAWAVHPLPVKQVTGQARAVLEDMPVAAVKIGLLGTREIAHAVAELLNEFPDLPVVLDPVLIAGGGARLAEDPMVPVLRDRLIPRATIITPNGNEARELADSDELDSCGERLLAMGCENVLITGGHESGDEVRNRLYSSDGMTLTEGFARLPGDYHGSGCTLASALAARIARGQRITEAAHSAEQYTWRALRAGFRPGRGQWIPGRFPGPGRDMT